MEGILNLTAVDAVSRVGVEQWLWLRPCCAVEGANNSLQPTG